YQAARAGLEWGIREAVKDGSCQSNTSLALDGVLAEFSGVVVTCKWPPDEYPDRENGKDLTLYTLTAVAQNAASPSERPDYAYRRLTAKVEKIENYPYLSDALLVADPCCDIARWRACGELYVLLGRFLALG